MSPRLPTAATRNGAFAALYFLALLARYQRYGTTPTPRRLVLGALLLLLAALVGLGWQLASRTPAPWSWFTTFLAYTLSLVGVSILLGGLARALA